MDGKDSLTSSSRGKFPSWSICIPRDCNGTASFSQAPKSHPTSLEPDTCLSQRLVIPPNDGICSNMKLSEKNETHNLESLLRTGLAVLISLVLFAFLLTQVPQDLHLNEVS